MITGQMLREDALDGIGAKLDPISALQVAASMDSNSALAEENFQLRLEVQNLDEALTVSLEREAKYKAYLDFLEKKCRESNTGITIESWKEYDNHTGNCTGRYFNVMWFHNICDRSDNFFGALDNAVARDKIVQT